MIFLICLLVENLGRGNPHEWYIFFASSSYRSFGFIFGAFLYFEKRSNLKGVLITSFAEEISESISGGEDFLETNGTDALILVDLDQDGDLDLITEDIAGRFFLNQNQMGEFSENLLLFPNPIIPFEANATIGTKVASWCRLARIQILEIRLFLRVDPRREWSGFESFSVNQDGSLVLDSSPKAGALKSK